MKRRRLTPPAAVGIKIKIIALALLFWGFAAHAASPESIMQHKQAFCDIITKTLHDIQTDLQELGKRFPILAEVKNAKLLPAETSESDPSSGQEETVDFTGCIRYQKGVVVRPDTSNESAKSGRPRMLDTHPSEKIYPEGASSITIVISNNSGKMECSKIYSLSDVLPKLELLYFFKTNPESKDLRKAIEEILSKNIEKLRAEVKKLQTVKGALFSFGLLGYGCG